MTDAFSRARLCNLGLSINPISSKCNIIPPCVDKPSNRTLYDDCTVDEPQFSVQQPTEQCLLKIEGEYEQDRDAIVSPIVCLGCGDKIQFIGMDGIHVEIKDGAVVISKP